MLRPVQKLLLSDLEKNEMFMSTKDNRIYRCTGWKYGRIFFYDTASTSRIYHAHVDTAEKTTVFLVKNLRYYE